jgi:opacity protein-like surface antigen
MKSLLTTLVLILFAFSGYSQTEKPSNQSTSPSSDKKEEKFQSEIKYGVRGGFNISNLDFTPDPTFENKHRNNMAFGGFVEFMTSEAFSIVTELQYSAEGGGKDEALRASFIQLPILFKLHLGNKFAIGAGPQVSLKSWSYEDGFKNVTYSAIGGIEYMINDELFIDARYTYGLSNLIDNDSNFEARNTNIQFGIGLKM